MPFQRLSAQKKELLNIEQLDVNDQAVFSLYSLIVPIEYHPFLLGKHPLQIPESSIIIIGAQSDDKPDAIAIASHDPVHRLTTLHYLYTVSNKGEDIQQMLTHVEKKAREKKSSLLTFVYAVDQPWTKSIEEALNALKWQPASPFMIRCFCALSFNAPWLDYNHLDYPAGYEEFFLSELSENETLQIQKIQRQMGISAFLSPFREKDLIEPLNSLGLRYQNQIVGWILTHRIDSETIRYTAMFVNQSIPYFGRAMIKMLAHSVRLHIASRIPRAMIEIPVAQVPSSWVNFVERRLFPYCVELIHLVQTWKKLQ